MATVSCDRDVINLIVGNTTMVILLSQPFTFGLTVASHKAPSTQTHVQQTTTLCTSHTFCQKHRPRKNLKKTLQKQNRYFKGLVEGWGPMVEYLSAISKVLGLMPRTTKTLKQNNHATKETSWKGANDSSCCPIL